MTTTERAATPGGHDGPGTDGWAPRLVALDIDGTLLRWTDESPATASSSPASSVEEIRPAVRDAVRRAAAAGAEVVLASGRSPYDMTRVADLLELHAPGAEPLWVVAANGAVVFRYPPVDVVHEETFDARDSVAAALERHPEAIVAVEERGVGYRMNRPFPPGELTGRHTLASVDELLAEPVTRVIIRDPQASVEDFVALAEGLGLHGTEYVVGWTAWLDIMPVGVSKASGLQHVVDRLGLTAGDVLAIGDGRNDVEMLRWAGRGVAMGQAVEAVHEAADDVTATVDDDGAAVELSRWF
ncbi:HAD family hydrolase [Nocardioides lentus]|uniref:HAD family hydrolase n=1 Tax=Nocardioides lentus TaxID=338077 RepID=A0ABP5A9E0_9ACTN